MVRAVERAHAIGAEALQVFIDNPTAWKRRAEPPAELPAFRERLASLGIGPVAVHASYLVNLAGPTDDLFERSVALLAHELVAHDYGARFVNVREPQGHRSRPGSPGRRGCVERAPVAGSARRKGRCPVLENSAGSGWDRASLEAGAIFEAIITAVARRSPGLCLDAATCRAPDRHRAPEGVGALVDGGRPDRAGRW
jgi:deoxyribonuclease-4